jgi:hypothetical protein
MGLINQLVHFNHKQIRVVLVYINHALIISLHFMIIIKERSLILLVK